MDMYLNRYHQMDYWHLIYRVDEFFHEGVEGYNGKEVLAGGLRHNYYVNGQCIAMTFWWKTAYVVITNETTDEILYSVHDPETQWMIGCFKNYFGLVGSEESRELTPV